MHKQQMVTYSEERSKDLWGYVGNIETEERINR